MSILESTQIIEQQSKSQRDSYQAELSVTMAPLKPHWPQPSHPDIQEVIINEAEFTSKSLSKVSLPPFAVYAKMSFPPCSVTSEPTYATVQMGNGKHLMLNSDLLYINHSCDPSLVKLPQTQIYHHPPVKTAVVRAVFQLCPSLL